MTILLVSYATYQMLQSMMLVIGAWILLTVLLIGLGLLLTSLVKLKSKGADKGLSFKDPSEPIRDFFGLFWIGFAFLLLLLLGWNMFFPVNFMAVPFVSVLSICGLFPAFLRSGTIFKSAGAMKFFYLVTLLAFALWLSNRAIGPNRHYDAGLYHLNQIRWAAEYAVVPGLANLHSRLGFPSAYPLFFSFVNSAWPGKASHICNGLLLFLFAAQVQRSAFRILSAREPRVHDVLQVFFGIPLALHCFVNASDTSTDLPLVLLSFVITVRLWQFVVTSKGRLWDAFVISTIAVAGMVCKSNFLAFGAVAIAIVMSRAQARSQYSLYVPAICLLGLWIFRSILLTGYPFYPIPLAGLPVDWRVPDHYAELLLQFIRNYGRLPESGASQTLAMSEWFPIWSYRLYTSIWSRFFILFPAIIVPGAIILSFFRKRLIPFSLTLRIVAPALAGIAFWLFTSPEPRFVAGSIWCLAGVFLVNSFASSDGTVNRKFGLTLLIIVTIACISMFPLLNKQVLLPPGKDRGFHPLHRVEFTQYKTESGLTLYVPRQGDQCWDSPLPCTPYPYPDLRLRKPGDLPKGFAVSK